MYYNRKLSDNFASLIEKNGNLKWLYDFVLKNKELDFLIGKNNSTEWISVYRGLSRILKIEPYKRSKALKFSAAKAYKRLAEEYGYNIYGNHESSRNFEKDLIALVDKIASDKKFNRSYNNKKEGYFQSILSRQYGICGNADDEFVILDKEVVIGYENESRLSRHSP